MKVVAVSGTNGAGKNTLVDFLVVRFGFEHIKVRDLIVQKAKEDGIELKSREDFINFTEGYYAQGKSLIKNFLIENQDSNKNFVIESIRRVAEVKDIKQHCPESIFISVDASVEVRFARILQRNTVTDHITFEKFLEDEKNESDGDKDTEMNIPEVIKMSDIVLDNSKTIEDFEEEVRIKVLQNPFFVRLA